MRIGINASFLRKQGTGIGQVTINFLRKLMEDTNSKKQTSKKDDVEFYLYLEEDVDLDLPKNFQKRIFLPKYKRDDLIRKIWWEKFMLPKKIKEDGCEVFFSLYQSATILKKFNGKHIMLAHDLIPRLFPEYLNNWRKKLYQNLTERAIKKADKILANSHRTEKDLIQHLGINPREITVSYIDVDPIYKKEISNADSEKVLQKYNLKPGYIYTGGGLEVRKNIEGVMRAYKILLGQTGQLIEFPKLVISGKLMPNLFPLVTDVTALVEGLELEKQVVLLDYVPQEDLPALYRNALMFVRPSFYEGFGLPELEAMNQGVPVITSKTSSLPEVGSDSVLYCDPNDVDDIAMVMKNVMKNEHLRAALSMKGRERAQHFSWEKFVVKFLHILNNRK